MPTPPTLLVPQLIMMINHGVLPRVFIIGCLKSFILTAKLKDGYLVNFRNNNSSQKFILNCPLFFCPVVQCLTINF